MLLAALIVFAACAGSEPTDLGLRIRASALAAQALQGPLDGTWSLRDRHGMILFRLRIVDTGGQRLQAAWSGIGGERKPAPVDAIVVHNGILSIRLTPDPSAGLGAGPVSILLKWHVGMGWVGRLNGRSRATRVILRQAES